jgi:tripartite-type tricarboxylate transporter receptor subunit TctC
MINRNTFTRRVAIAACAGALLPMQAGAQAPWPSKPVKLAVPFAAGGSNDIVARLIAAKLSTRLGQPVVVENKGGGGGTIGTEMVVRAPADGHTLLFASASITTNVASGKKLGYDLLTDLVPIGAIAATPLAIVVSNEVKAKTLGEFIAFARANPKNINYGSAGTGGMNHLGTELFATAAKLELVHIPYKGIAPAFTDLMGGSLQLLLPSLASVIPHIRSGKMRALAVTAKQRSPLAPDIPTAAEAGLPGFQLEVWFGLMGPSGLPPTVLKRLNEELNAVLAMPEVKEVLAREAAWPYPTTPSEYGRLISSEVSRWSRLIKENNIVTE